ncbi:polysaccharide pyruvyl transferase family protein [Rhodococcoides yunnanense]|uniref:Polysaccharide pyruvyl transferase family protein n=1 Tax=Rhodococcoides yunnanense TaxID=278209 RepID=A0ABU4B778_9NOCA|nr:polysaccharide pyruvyl transferase family protein [Rhodococcus yunnanensis]MDV6260041.1 polysaccharide pyruvyl transferase family protein [Rhodococcus yunnanensis]
MSSQKRPKVLVLWADPAAENLGLQALAAGVRAVAGRSWGECDVTFHSHNTLGTPLRRKLALQDFGRRGGPIVGYLGQFDVVMDTGGGDSFTDIYGIQRLLLMAYIQRACRKAKVSLVMTPQTIGPFQTYLGRVVASRLLTNVDVLCTRDPVSSRVAIDIGRTPSLLATDMAFALPRPTPMKQRDVVLNVSGLLWQSNPHVDSVRYRAYVVDLADRLLAADRRVTLLAHVLDSPVPDNDVPAVYATADAISGEVEIVIPEDLEEARNVLAGSRVLVGSRMHSAINALSVGVPAISWAYSRKFGPLMDALGWQHTIDLTSGHDPVPETLQLITADSFQTLRDAAPGVATSAEGKIEEMVAVLSSHDLFASFGGGRMA